jgi:hypothetical protein
MEKNTRKKIVIKYFNFFIFTQKNTNTKINMNYAPLFLLIFIF